MKKILFLIIFSSIGFVGCSQYGHDGSSRYETVSNIIKLIDIGTYNGVKNTALDAGIFAIQFFKVIKVLKSANIGYNEFSRPVAPDPFIIPFDPSTGLELNLHK